MRVARWRWVIVSLVVVVAGCLPQPAFELPPSLLEEFGGPGVTFTVQPLPAGATGQDVVETLRENSEAMFRGRSVVVFGRLDCHGRRGCTPGPAGTPGGARMVWVLLYPDCKATGSTEAGWAVVDATNGVAGPYMFRPCSD
jgi:hypothetical protein